MISAWLLIADANTSDQEAADKQAWSLLPARASILHAHWLRAVVSCHATCLQTLNSAVVEAISNDLLQRAMASMPARMQEHSGGDGIDLKNVTF